MPWPVKDAWNQHLDEMNAQNYSRPFAVSLVRIEGPFEEKDAFMHTRHVHPYWQVGVVFEESYSVHFDDITITPQADDIILIPPQNWHYINFFKGKKAWTVKFVIEELDKKYEPALIELTSEMTALSHALRELLKLPDTDSKFLLIEHLLSAMMDLHLKDNDMPNKEVALIRKARGVIEKKLLESGSARVEDIAEKMGITTTYLTRTFKKQLGVPLKVYIDQLRFDMAKSILKESSSNISEIAEEMGFIDVFSFSRFFKRMSGESPRDFLKKWNK